MKLNEITVKVGIPESFAKLDSKGHFTELADVDKWLSDNTINTINYTFDNHETLDVHLLNIKSQSRGYMFTQCNFNKLPVQFSAIDRDLTIALPSLKTLEGLPSFIDGNLNLVTCSRLSGWDGYPEIIGGTLGLPSNTSSLIGIHEKILEIGSTAKTNPPRSARLIIEDQLIQKGGLGLVLIKTLDSIHRYGPMPVDPRGPFAIIEKYLGKPDKVFECQSELIDAGFEEYAQL